MNTLELFYFDSCPFCIKVLVILKELKIKVSYLDIFESSNLDRLVNDTGRRTVPCLYVNGKPMHESRKIIDWLKENIDDLEKE